MPKLPPNTLRVKVYAVLVEAVEHGTVYGVNRAFKYTDKPTRETIVAHVAQAVINEICEWFDFDDEAEP